MIGMMLSLLEKCFTDWDAYKLGLIDQEGRLLESKRKREDMLPSEILAEEEALSDTAKMLIKIKKFLGEGKIEKLKIYAEILKEQEENTIREKSLIMERVAYKHKLKDIDYEIERVLTKNGITRDEYYKYLMA
jgi:hypothetical protein